MPLLVQNLGDYAYQLRAIDETAVLVLVGNKADLLDERQISDADLAAVAETFTAPFLLTSALTSTHVAAAFHHLAEAIERPL